MTKSSGNASATQAVFWARGTDQSAKQRNVTMASNNNRGSASQQSDKQSNKSGSGGSQKGSGQGQVKDPQNDGRLKENR